MQFFKTSSLVGLGQDYVEWTLRGEFSHCRVQITFDGDTGAALGCQVVQDTGTPGSAKILSAASIPGAGAARELFAGLEDITFIISISPRLFFVWFLFLILYPGPSPPPRPPAARLSHTTQLCHTPSLTHHHTSLSITIFHTPSFTHHLSHTLSHTTSTPTIFTRHLSHTITHLCQPPSFTHHVSHTIISHTLSLTHFVTHNFDTHHFSHTISHTQSLTHLGIVTAISYEIEDGCHRFYWMLNGSLPA